MKKILTIPLAALIIAPLSSTLALTDDPGFSRYQIILDKAPFGKPPPPPKAKPPPVVQKPTGPSWVESYRMTMLMVDDDEQPRIGLVNVKDNYSFTLGIADDPIDGIRLKSVDYQKQSATVDKGGDVQDISMQELAAIPPATPAKKPATSGTSVRDKYLARRKEMEKKRQVAMKEPKFQGAELEQHLKDYQMEVLRKGLPPLPVPLTPEMDNQLVEEGVLPPLQ